MLQLRAELQKAKEATQLANEAVEAEKQASYTLSVEETQATLIEELAKVCKDYCMATWAEALNLARVPIDLKWKQPGNVYYHSEIRETPIVLPSPSATASESSKQPLTAQAALSLPEILKGPSHTGDQGQGVKGAKDKGKGKETNSSSEAKDVAKAKAKEIKAKTKEIDPQTKDVPAS